MVLLTEAEARIIAEARTRNKDLRLRSKLAEGLEALDVEGAAGEKAA